MKQFVKNITPPFAWALTKNVKEENSPPPPPRLFDGDSQMFERIVADARIYGEYGVGASTNYVYDHTNCSIIAVETSPAWATDIGHGKDLSRVSITLVDLGPVGLWGRPVDYSHRFSFQQYTDSIWTHTQKPDVVLIDGRFRVACFLTSLIHAEVGAQIIFDDYIDRPFYHIVESVLPLQESCGRQVRFERPHRFNEALAHDLLEKFRYVFE